MEIIKVSSTSVPNHVAGANPDDPEICDHVWSGSQIRH